MPLLVLSPTTFLPVLSLIITKSPFAMHVVIERRGVVGDNTNNGENCESPMEGETYKSSSPSPPERDLG